jgi:hypothetical protein
LWVVWDWRGGVGERPYSGIPHSVRDRLVGYAIGDDRHARFHFGGNASADRANVGGRSASVAYAQSVTNVNLRAKLDKVTPVASVDRTVFTLGYCPGRTRETLAKYTKVVSGSGRWADFRGPFEARILSV